MSSISLIENSDFEKYVKDLIKQWELDRDPYPGWIVLPEVQRKQLWLETYTAVQIFDWDNFVRLEPIMKSNFLYELNWRYRICLALMPAQAYQQIQILLEDHEFWKDFRVKNRGDNFEIWFQLIMSILQYHRVNGNFVQYETLIMDQEKNSSLKDLIALFNPEQYAHWHYERVLHAIYSLDFDLMRKELNEWEENSNLPYWESKRASFYIELGNIEKAKSILENALRTLRKQINLKVNTENINIISQEGIILLFLLRIEEYYIKLSSLKDSKDIPTQVFENIRTQRTLEQELSFNADYISPLQSFKEPNAQQSYLKQLRKRLSALQEWKSDLRVHLEWYAAALDQPLTFSQLVNIEPAFDLAEVIDSITYNAQDTNDILGTQFMLFLEETGIPYRIKNFTYEQNTVIGAVKRINFLHSWWSFVSVLRIGDPKNTDIKFDRENLASLSVDSINDMVKLSIKSLEWCDANLSGHHPLWDVCLPVYLARILPELLSRLCTKCSHELQEEILDTLLRLYQSKNKIHYQGVQNLVKRLITSWSKDKSHKLVQKLFEFPEVGSSKLINLGFIDPFAFFQGKISYAFPEASQKIEQILQSCFSENIELRMRSLSKTYQLFNANLLNEEQAKQFGKSLWGDSSDIPKNTGFYECFFLRLPHPEDISPEQTFKNYVQKAKFPIGDSSLYNADPTNLLSNILGGSKTLFSNEGVDWSADESLDMLIRLLKWWNTDKRILDNQLIDVFQEGIVRTLRDRFQYLSRILSDIVLPRFTTDNITADYKERIGILLEELKKYGVPHYDALVASIPLFPERKDAILKELLSDAFSNNLDDINKAFRGICIALRLEQQGKIELDNRDLLKPMIDCIQWRRLPGMLSAMQFMKFFVQEMPDKLDGQKLEAMLMGLEKLFMDTFDSKNQSTPLYKDRFTLRFFGMQLAAILFKQYYKDKTDIPNGIKCWQEISQSQNEFWDIRNQWDIDT
jgi:hypothetical protein